jgi:long-chain acyl-CoA synthetase
VGEDGEEAGEGEVGELAIQGPGVSAGYFKDPEETRNCMKDGWFFTGDLATRDADGYFYFAARKSGMMKVAGIKVFPMEIEEVLCSHPQVAEAAVVKVDDRLHGEIPKAVIVLKTGEKMDKRALRRYCEKRLAPYKLPRIIEFRSQLPRTSGGKILYREL